MKLNKQFPKEFSLVPLKDTIVFPQSILSVYITQEESKKIITTAFNDHKFIFTSAYENSKEDMNNVYKVGCVSLIMRMKTMEDGRFKILIQGLCRATIKSFKKDSSKVEVDCFFEDQESPSSKEEEKQVYEVKNILKELSYFKESISPDFLLVINSIKNPGQICDLILSNLDLKIPEVQKILETFNISERLEKTKNSLLAELEISRLQGRIQNLLKKELPKPLFNPYEGSKHQREANSFKKEEVNAFVSRIEKKTLPKEVKEEAYKQLSRLEKMHTESSESSMIRNYLDWILDLPWVEYSEDNLDLKNAKAILDRDHFELKKVKERVLEFLAIRTLNPKNLKGPIICFAGPPGVGKTSLGKSIATAMGRSYQRISLGGIKDEAEIRGHRRTYVGAMPGKIIQAIKSCNTNNPVIVLDEIDKLGNDFRGDPSSALLEVLDPEQNHSFKDHYLNLNFDLSNVLFIATANVIQNISPALKDRLEVISLSGYTQTEKVEIAKKYLIEKESKCNGLPENHIQFTEDSLKHLVVGYTQEAGLRNLKREISSICRKIAKNYVLGSKEKQLIDKKTIIKLLGSPYFHPEELLKESKVGVATGLAWTSVGGQILHVEAIKIKNKKGGLLLTGKLGEVMKESAQAALSYVKSYTELNIAPEWFEKNEIHIHLPGGAIPKDGPSAGVTLASSLISLITNTPVKNNLAMTGEITLSGRVLPVGGIKEKVLAAFNQGITNIILPKQNKKDLKDIKKEIRENLNFILVSNLDEVFKTALLIPEPIEKQSIKKLLENKNLGDVA